MMLLLCFDVETIVCVGGQLQGYDVLDVPVRLLHAVQYEYSTVVRNR